MIGKKNIVFGFLYLVLTAALGPYMVTQFDIVQQAQQEKQQALGRLEQLQANNFEEDLEALSAEQIAKANTAAALALNKQVNARAPIDAIKAGPHTHGNLEALLNIVVGIVLGLLVIAPLFKQVISWVFILGALLHSGMLYLSVVFNQGWAGAVLNTGIGPALVLLGLLLMGIASVIGLKGNKPV